MKKVVNKNGGKKQILKQKDLRVCSFKKPRAQQKLCF